MPLKEKNRPKPCPRDGISPVREKENEERLPFDGEALAQTLLTWFSRNMRDLPWRCSYSPYEVWISEIMLQQTRMERGALFYKRWMKTFPTLQSVASASPEAVLKAWEGLGYYSRARNLHRTAQLIVAGHGGNFPSNFAALRALPGIGDYTAGAVLSIAFNQPLPAVDANVERVLARIFNLDKPAKSDHGARFIRRMAARLIPHGKAREFNQALMEFGSLVCGKAPSCGNCPVVEFCRAKRLDTVAKRPVPGKSVACTSLCLATAVLAHNGRVYVQKRPESGLWASFWEFPFGVLEQEESPETGSVRAYSREAGLHVRVVDSLGSVRQAYTRFRTILHGFLCVLEPKDHRAGKADSYPRPILSTATEHRWATLEELDGLVFPAGHRKLLSSKRRELERALAVESGFPQV